MSPRLRASDIRRQGTGRALLLQASPELLELLGAPERLLPLPVPLTHVRPMARANDSEEVRERADVHHADARGDGAPHRAWPVAAISSRRLQPR